MTAPGSGEPPGPEPGITYRSGGQVQVDLLRYWSTTFVVAAIASLAGITVVRLAGDVFDTPLLVPDRGGSETLVALSDSRVIWSCLLVTLAAAGVLNLMLYLVPRPAWFFQVLCVVALIASLLFPFSLDVDTSVQAWLVGVHVTVGIIIMSLTASIAGSVTRVVVTDVRR
ncbi:MAG: DUF6069 family protein [Actinomycetota bacterium]